MKSAQSVREELMAAVTVQVLVVLSTEEQLEEEGETPRRPGGGGRGRGGEGSVREERLPILCVCNATVMLIHSSRVSNSRC